MSRAAIFKNVESESAVALCSEFNVIGSLKKQGLFQVAIFSIHVGNAVLAVVCDVLGGIVSQQTHEGELSGHILGSDTFLVVFELCATVDGFTEPDVLLLLDGLVDVPILLGNAVWVGVDAGLTSREVAECSDGIRRAALVGVNPVESACPVRVAES